MNFTVTVTGLEELQITLKSLAGALAIESMLDEAAASILDHLRKHYLDQIDPDGNDWVPSQAGLLRESSGGPGTGYDTGMLFRSIQLFSSSDGERVIGTDRPYAAGFDQGHSGLAPPRHFLGFGDEDEKIVDAILKRRVDQALEK